MSSDLSRYRSAVVKSIVEELTTVKQEVSEVSASLRTKVSSTDDKKAEEVGKRLEHDIGILGARYEALVGLANETARTDVLDAFERRLNATDAILDAVEEALHRNEGLEPVIVPPNSELDIGLPFGAVSRSGDSGSGNGSMTDANVTGTGASSNAAQSSASPIVQARALARAQVARTEALAHRTPVRSRTTVLPTGASLVTPVRTAPLRRVEDELPPTPKLSDFGIMDPGLFSTDLNFSMSNTVAASSRVNINANASPSTDALSSTRSHIVQEATSPEQEDQQTYNETVTRHMARLGLRQSQLGIRQDEDDDDDDGDMTYDETITRQMEQLGIDDTVTQGYR